MRNPIIVLKNLSKNSCNKDYLFKRLYRNLYNPEFYLLAYKNIYANKGSMTKGIDNLTLDGMSIYRIQKIIQSLKDHSYQPKPVRREYIPKKNSNKKRPLGIASSDDKLVQEVIKMILESIYEPTFLDNSHGFRPKRSCHTALITIQHTYTGSRWFIEGDIKSCFDSFDHHTLIKLLRKRIKDEYFISLIWKLLKAGYMENWVYNQSYSGAIQGSGASPILANIYLNELDTFITKYKENFDKGKERRLNPEYKKAEGKAYYMRTKYKKIWNTLDENEKLLAKKHVKELKRQIQDIHTTHPQDRKYRRLQYVRYADDFLIGVIGNKKDSLKIKNDIKIFLESELKLSLSDTKTLVTHSNKFARFLGYDITVSRNRKLMKSRNGIKNKLQSYKVKLYVPKDKWVGKLREYNAFKIIKHKDNKEYWRPQSRGELINKENIEIISKYNSEIRGIYNFYCLANNATVLHNFSYVMEYSMYKTFAAKYRKTKTAIIRRFSLNGEFGINYRTKSGIKRAVFYNQGFKRKYIPLPFNADILPENIKYDHPKSIIGRLKAGMCELCKCKTNQIQMHQVKKLKDLTGIKEWEKVMISIRRKTLALCPSCHTKLHEGLLD